MSVPRREFEEELRTRRRDSRRRILDAAAALIEERPWHQIALEQVMVRAELSRTAFYRHFGERSDLLLALLEESGMAEDPAGAVWKESPDDPAGSMRVACKLLTELFVRHGRLLQAAAEAAVDERAVAVTYQAFADSFVATTAERIERDRQAGRTHIRNAREVARALVWMNERYLLQCFGRRPFTAEPEVAAAALGEIWAGAVYHS
jgi:AcrR family transcriptional regulator